MVSWRLAICQRSKDTMVSWRLAICQRSKDTFKYPRWKVGKLLNSTYQKMVSWRLAICQRSKDTFNTLSGKWANIQTRLIKKWYVRVWQFANPPKTPLIPSLESGQIAKLNLSKNGKFAFGNLPAFQRHL